jgi:hypothetical protein
MGGREKHEANEEGEIALVAFQGVCFICNKKGHRAHECPNKRANGSNGNGYNGKANGYNDKANDYNGKANGYNGNGNGYNGNGIRRAARGNGPNCGHCGKPNHVEQQCWRKPGNEHLKPDWLKKKEQANPSVDEGPSPELLLCCLEVNTELTEHQLCGLTFPTAQKILSDPNVWITDSAATTHSTGHTEGLYDLRHTGTSDNIFMGNGAKESVHSIGKLTGTICDQYGNQLVNKTTMQDVTHLLAYYWYV